MHALTLTTPTQRNPIHAWLASEIRPGLGVRAVNFGERRSRSCYIASWGMQAWRSLERIASIHHSARTDMIYTSSSSEAIDRQTYSTQSIRTLASLAASVVLIRLWSTSDVVVLAPDTNSLPGAACRALHMHIYCMRQQVWRVQARPHP